MRQDEIRSDGGSDKSLSYLGLGVKTEVAVKKQREVARKGYSYGYSIYYRKESLKGKVTSKLPCVFFPKVRN